MRGWLTARASVGAWVYLTGLFGWAGLYAAFEDRWFGLFALTSFAGYLFLPLAGVAAIAAWTRSRALGVGCALAR